MRIDADFTKEMNLGQRLNQAVNQQRRSDFSLMLAMMVQDVRYQGQFQLLRQEDGQPLPLRRQFQLPDEAPLEEQFNRDQRNIENAKAFQIGGLVQARLQDCLAPSPLSVRGRYCAGLQQAIENSEPWVTRPDPHKPQFKPLPPGVDLADLISEQRLQSETLSVAC
ncbi:MAG: VC2046/SO_2500 family protein [Ferrimonas sp.]